MPHSKAAYTMKGIAMGFEYGKMRWFMEKVWSEKTYAEEIDYFEGIKYEDMTSLVRIVVSRLGLMDKKMDGSSIEGIAIKTEGKTYVSFAGAFDRCLDGYLSPVSYIAAIASVCCFRNLDIAQTVEQVGRGLRAFPSFIREYDLRCGLERVFEERGVHMNATSGVRLDVEEHTDVMLSVATEKPVGGSFSCQRYRLWSYIPSERGIYNLTQKLLGRRAGGEPVPGIHVLCPFPFFEEKTVVQGWYLHPEDYFGKVFDAVMACHRAILKGENPTSAGTAVSYGDLIADPNAYVKSICVFEK